MAEFYFTAAIANGYEYRNTPDNYRHFLMELPVKPSIKQQLNQAKKEQGEREDKKPPSHKPPEL